MMRIVNLLAGGVISCVGIAVWYIDYLVFTAIGSLGAYVASVIGATGTAAMGVIIVAWILTLGIMVGLLLAGIALFLCGIVTAFGR